MSNGESAFLPTLLNEGVPDIAMYSLEQPGDEFSLSRRVECNGIDSSRERMKASTLNMSQRRLSNAFIFYSNWSYAAVHTRNWL